jgi:hypothetical protein
MLVDQGNGLGRQQQHTPQQRRCRTMVCLPACRSHGELPDSGNDIKEHSAGQSSSTVICRPQRRQPEPDVIEERVFDFLQVGAVTAGLSR